MLKLKKKITYYSYLISPKIRLIIKLIRMTLTLMTLLNTSPDWYTYIDYLLKNGLEDSEVAYELELTERQKWYLKIGCIIASITFTVFIVYVLNTYNITPSIEKNPVAANSEELKELINEYAIKKIYPFLIETENNNASNLNFDNYIYNFDKALMELMEYIKANKDNINLFNESKFLELEKKVEIAYKILDKDRNFK